MARKFMGVIMMGFIFLIPIEVQADDESFHHSSKALDVIYIPEISYYCITRRIESCDHIHLRRWWLRIFRNLDHEICILESFETCMINFPIFDDPTYRATAWCLHTCQQTTNIMRRKHIACLLDCYRKHIKQH
jgi:hypothetical protein